MNASLGTAALLWPMLLGATVIGLVQSDPSPVEGEIIFEHAAYCDYFVVKSPLGFTLLEAKDSLVEIASGNRVTGRLVGLGAHPLVVDGRVSILAIVKGHDQDLAAAKARFDLYCEPDRYSRQGVTAGT
jgi:hypothetical protein